jgi:predicted nucleic-acid-binding Zn-ribbon protein
MMPVSQSELDRIIEILKNKGAIKPCPRCGNEEFTLLDAFSKQNMQDSPKGPVILGGQTIPCAVVICQNCGFLSYHALGYLGLLSGTDNLKEE